MINPKQQKKSHRNQLALQFKQKSQLMIKREPSNYLCTFIKQTTLTLNLDEFKQQDMPFFEILMLLPFTKIIISIAQPQLKGSRTKKAEKSSESNNVKVKPFYQTLKFRELLKYLHKSIIQSSILKEVKIIRVPLSIKIMKQFSHCISQTQRLKQIGFIDCSLEDQHLQTIKNSLATNESLISLDLSFNNFYNIGGMIGKILSQHSRRRTQSIWVYNLRGQLPPFDVSSSGICEINLEANHLNDKAALQLLTFMRDDNWTRCVNLRKNQFKESIRDFALLMKNNTSLISLDLRQNQGFTREYSRYIYKKLVINMEKYKQSRGRHHYSTQTKNQNLKGIKLQNSNKKSKQQPKSSIDIGGQQKKQLNNYASLKFNNQNIQYTTNPTVNFKSTSRQVEIEPFNQNKTVDVVKKRFSIKQSNKLHSTKQCNNCRQNMFKLLKVQKKNMDLQLQLHKLKDTISKNIEISSISQPSIVQWFANKSNENQQQFVVRMEQMLLQLTKILETVEDNHQTKINITNPIENLNSFSNTHVLYNRNNSELEQFSKAVQQDLSGNVGEIIIREESENDTFENQLGQAIQQ